MSNAASTNSDDALLDYLASLSPRDWNLPARARLVVESNPHTTAAEAMKEFLKLDGEGWLQTAESPTIYLLPAKLDLDKTLKTKVESEWPIAGERHLVDGASLHIRRAGDGWILCRLAREEHPKSVLVESRLLIERRYWLHEEARRWLCYEVGFELPQHGNAADGPKEGVGALIGTAPLRELRPTQFRFVGFDPPLQP